MQGAGDRVAARGSDVKQAAENPKLFYGNANLPADGHDRVAFALRTVSSLKTRLEALVRGK